MTCHDHMARALAAWRSRYSLLSRAREWWDQNPERGRRLALAAFRGLHPTLLETVMRDLEGAPRMERRGVYVSERPAMDRIRAAQVRGNHAHATELARRAFRGLRDDLLQEVLEDLRETPVMERPGTRVYPLCRECGGSGVVVHPLMRRDYWRLDPEMRGDWEVPCPRCGGEGVEPEVAEGDLEGSYGEDIAHNGGDDGFSTPDRWDGVGADVSWDWPPEDVVNCSQNPERGYDGREAR
jgi:hypothetical protein